MIAGLILGSLSSLFMVFIGLIICENVDYDHEKYVWIGTSIIILIITLLGGWIGMQLDITEYNKKIANWNNTKLTIESSMKNENISDLEKIDLVNKIVEYNMQLTESKEDVKQWWYFYLDDSKVNELEIIKIN